MSYEYLRMETIGNDAMLTCQAGGKPRPRISWVDFEGRPIPTGGKKFKVSISHLPLTPDPANIT